MPGICCACDSTGATNACSKCQRVYYCDRTCQKPDWPRHKVVCRRAGSDTMEERSAASLIGVSLEHLSAVAHGVLVRTVNLPTLDTVIARWRRPLMFSPLEVRHNSPQFQLVHLTSASADRKLSSDELAGVAWCLQAGADPNTAYVAYNAPSDYAFAAVERTVVDAQTPFDIKLPVEAEPDRLANVISVLERVVESADRDLMNVLKAHSNLPLDASAVSCCFNARGECRTVLDLLQVGVAGPTDKVEGVRLALELGCTPQLLHASRAPRLNAWVTTAPAIFLVTHGCFRASPDEAEAILRLLVDNGADLNAVNSAGTTFLSEALQASRTVVEDEAFPTVERVVQVALELGADPDLVAAAPQRPYTPAWTVVAWMCADIRAKDVGPDPGQYRTSLTAPAAPEGRRG